MADDFDYALDNDFDWDEDGWMYVEDGENPVDELAEGQVPDPGYAGVNEELAMESYEFDLFGYFEDLEYGEDDYWEKRIATSDRDVAEVDERRKVVGKRKRQGNTQSGNTGKRMKADTEARGEQLIRGGYNPVLYISRSERNFPRSPPTLRDNGRFALLPDWRLRFADQSGETLSKAMPADMRHAAEARDENTPLKARHHHVQSQDAEAEGDWEDEEVADGDDAGEDALGMLAGVDMATLKMVLQQRLEEAGMAGPGGVGEEAFMASIQQMLAGGGDAEEASGQLAEVLLGKATKGGDDKVKGWLSGQGVKVDATVEDDEDGESAAGAQERLNDSPLDSGISLSEQPATSSQETAARTTPRGKRKADAVLAETEVSPTRKKSSRTSNLSHRTVAPKERSVKQDVVKPAAAPSYARSTKAADARAATGQIDHQSLDTASTTSTTKSRKRRADDDTESAPPQPAKKTRGKGPSGTQSAPSGTEPIAERKTRAGRAAIRGGPK